MLVAVLAPLGQCSEHFQDATSPAWGGFFQCQRGVKMDPKVLPALLQANLDFLPRACELCLWQYLHHWGSVPSTFRMPLLWLGVDFGNARGVSKLTQRCCQLPCKPTWISYQEPVSCAGGSIGATGAVFGALSGRHFSGLGWTVAMPEGCQN